MEILKDSETGGISETDERMTQSGFTPGSRIADLNPEGEDIIKTESGENLFKYIAMIGVRKETSLILSSQHHYYYEEGDLRNVSAIINLKPLNYIYDLESMLRAIYRLMPEGSSFIGFFADKNNISRKITVNDNKLYPGLRVYKSKVSSLSRFNALNRMYNFIDVMINRNLSDRTLTRLFMMNGFRIVDITEINGFKYFTAKHLTYYSA